MLHHKTIEKIAKQNAELFQKEGEAAVIKALPKTYDGKDIDDVDQEAIIARLKDGITPDPAPKVEAGTQANGIDLSDIDYRNLQGDAWEKYQERASKLVLHKKYLFEVYAVSAVKKYRYPGMKDSPLDIVGIRLEKDKPLTTVSIEARDAANLNAQLPNATSRVPMKYYLLKK